MKQLMPCLPLLLLLAAAGLSACDRGAQSRAPEQQSDIPPPPPRAGVIEANFDRDVAPGKDFYRHVNGTWLAENEIPDDRSSYGAFTVLADRAELQIRNLLEALAKEEKHDNPEDQQLAAFYRSFMDDKMAEVKGLKPVQDLLDEIAELPSAEALPEFFGNWAAKGLPQPLSFWVGQDARDATQYIAYLHQGDQIGLPDRSFYLDEGERFEAIRAAYVDYLADMLTRIKAVDDDDDDEGAKAKAAAEAVMALETRLAKAHWTRVESRDRERTYNRFTLGEVNTLTGDFDLQETLTAAGLDGNAAVIVMQPDAITELTAALGETEWSTVQQYLELGVMRQFAPTLSEDFVEAHFDFFARTLRGVSENRPRWKRAVSAVEASLGEALGKRYVEKHFPPEAKARMERMVDYLTKAYAQSIEELAWMGEDTKKKALEKLAKFNTKIGYPDQWRDYSALKVEEGDLVGNLRRSAVLEAERQRDKIGQPVDRDEWFMTPQTVNAYYSPSMNEIVFPAAILQPPFFDLDAEDAINFGAIGAVIGHEIGHGFDDQGSKYDGDGNLKNWWTEDDRKAFDALTAKLVEQYNNYCPLEGHCVNGALALGENIGDLGGLSIARKAYLLSAGKLPPPIIDGYTAEQRLFIGWAQVWARNFREEEMITRLKTGPHAPDEFRTNGVVRNIDAWYTAFDIEEDAPLYLAPEARVSIW
jgi:putative endopeptidase